MFTLKMRETLLWLQVSMVRGSLAHEAPGSPFLRASGEWRRGPPPNRRHPEPSEARFIPLVPPKAGFLGTGGDQREAEA